jgi:hypothetical protein
MEGKFIGVIFVPIWQVASAAGVSSQFVRFMSRWESHLRETSWFAAHLAPRATIKSICGSEVGRRFHG